MNRPASKRRCHCDKNEFQEGLGRLAQVAKPHWIQARTQYPITLDAGQRLRVTIDQVYGGQHLLGRFAIRALTGDERDLHLPREIVNFLKMYPEKRINDTRDSLFDFYAKQDPVVRELREKSMPSTSDTIQNHAGGMIATSRQSRETHRFDRGDFLSPAEKVEPGTLSAIVGLNVSGERPTRLDLARWLVGQENLLPHVSSQINSGRGSSELASFDRSETLVFGRDSFAPGAARLARSTTATIYGGTRRRF